MAIASISIKPQDKKQIDIAMRLCGTDSLSKLFRMALSSLIKEYGEVEGLKGKVMAVFTITYAGRCASLNQILHSYSGNLKLSTHIRSEKGCAEIVVVEGDAAGISRLFKDLRNNKEVKNVSCAFA
ncbi:MAG: hypothetical protein WC492_03140 [Candidatus Micrarchaeia archaeon]